MRRIYINILSLIGAIVLVVAAGSSLLAETPNVAALATFRDCPECPEMVTIPAGSFMMGSSDAERLACRSDGRVCRSLDSEKPQHQVSIEQFSMSATEITHDQFKAFARATGYQAGGPCQIWVGGWILYILADDWRDRKVARSGKHPVVCLNWNDATAYAAWLSQVTGHQYRLPTEAQWEYAARAGSVSPLPWGADIHEACAYENVGDISVVQALGWNGANYFACSDGFVDAAPVAHFRTNSFGLYDMLGNVSEWTADCWNENFNGAPADGSPWLTGDCTRHVVRGGHWATGPSEFSAAYRFGSPETSRLAIKGFRVIRVQPKYSSGPGSGTGSGDFLGSRIGGKAPVQQIWSQYPRFAPNE